MNQGTNVVETNTASFQADAIQPSHNHLVMVDFWADWCGPCKSLAPMLEKLVGQYNGSLKLVKVNTDENQDLAGHFGIKSLPTVFFLKNGQVVDQFMGVQPESNIKAIIDKHVEAPPESPLDQAIALYASGNVDTAIALVNQIILDSPGNDEPKLLMVNWLFEKGQLEDASLMAETISDDGKKNSEYKAFVAKMEFADTDNDGSEINELEELVAKNENDLDARFQLANGLVAANRLEEALDQLLEIIRRDRGFGDDAPRKTMIKIFEMCGGQGEIVSKYRRALLSILN